jgi:hypothetical protein
MEIKGGVAFGWADEEEAAGEGAGALGWVVDWEGPPKPQPTNRNRGIRVKNFFIFLAKKYKTKP